ncbi:hypothetical protein LguiB_006508 [Lonicera macranthoides]
MANVKRNDWSQLPYDLLGSITNRLGAFEDFAALSSVCTSWRSALLKEENWSKHCVPWLLFGKFDSSYIYRHYLLIPTLNKKKNKYNVIEPLITNAKRCWGSSIGWVFTLAHDSTTALVNPLNGVRITLPPLTESITKALVFVNGTDKNNNNNVIVMVITDYKDRYSLFFARPGFGEWISVEDHENGGFADVACYEDQENGGFADVACQEDKIFGVRSNGALVMCQIDNVSDARVTNFAPPPELVNFDHVGRLFLIESAGGLLMALVRRMYSKRNEAFVQVYKFNIKTRSWGELNDLGDCTLFLGDNYSISVFPTNGVDCISNCIYFGTVLGVLIFCMKDKKQVVHTFPYFTEGNICHISPMYLAHMLSPLDLSPVWVMPSLW